MRITQYFWNIVGRIYKKIYGEELTEARSFVRNTLLIALGFGIASIITGFFTIYAGNVLGPENYGLYVLITSVAGFLIIACLLGLRTALVNFSARSKTKKIKQMVISTTLILVALLTFISCTIFYFLSPILSVTFSVPITIIHYAILLTVFLSIYYMGNSILESNFMMKKRAYVQIICATFTIVSFIIILQFVRSYLSILLAVIIGYVAAFLPTFYFNREYIKKYYNKRIAKSIFKYGSYACIAGLSASVLSYIDRFMINYYLDTASVGVYHAYFNVSLFLPGFIMGMIIVVFFPTASRVRNKFTILTRVDRTIKYLPIMYIPFLIVGMILYKFYGSAYHLDFLTLMIFSIDAVLIISTGLYSRLTASVGISGARFLGKFVPLKAGLNVFLNLLLIPSFGINGAIGTTVVCDLISTCVYRFIYLRRNIQGRVEVERNYE